MKLRKSEIRDLPEILAIIGDAKGFLKSQGLDQWQSTYPSEEDIMKDIECGYSHVLEDDGRIMCTGAILETSEKFYEVIYGGSWITDGRYMTIHRLATRSDSRGKGTASRFMEETALLCREKGLPSIRIDTHSGNLPMQRMLEKNGFIRCGTIIFGDEGERIAFEKVL
ncbi:GNAT family N-acetyltransferase [Youngiibacter fragilis]|uniref:GNAT family acetyltransferase n=1 Tax=Youngiibacter fragilis 232.1 TaxID=994573 RepID=V7I8W3_9CLOT|nr:GNAT family N-acetyltransferase [Youngiibacter fragilis]ETA82630.1 GNAT family acetyltransferase [Youngiibacter fragilis 232.1]